MVDTMERTKTLARDETDNLIASNKVEGTEVFNHKGEKLGKVENFMVGKRSGRVEYAVMSFGGILGIGEDHYPLPWDALDYDTEKDGYRVDIDKDKLKGAPSYRSDTGAAFNRQYGERVYSYYGIAY
jgi:sporulation protein YlmC with PRC-barrel domain